MSPGGRARLRIHGRVDPWQRGCPDRVWVHLDDGTWTQVESYVASKTDAQFSHGVCPTCEEILYGGSPPIAGPRGSQ